MHAGRFYFAKNTLLSIIPFTYLAKLNSDITKSTQRNKLLNY